MGTVPESSFDHIEQAFANLKPVKGVVDINVVRASLKDPELPADKEVKDQ